MLEGVDTALPFTHVLVSAGAFLLLVPQDVLPAPTARFVGIDGAQIADRVLSGLLLSGLNQMARWHRPGGDLRANEVIDQYLDIVLMGLINRAGPPARPPGA